VNTSQAEGLSASPLFTGRLTAFGDVQAESYEIHLAQVQIGFKGLYQIDLVKDPSLGPLHREEFQL